MSVISIFIGFVKFLFLKAYEFSSVEYDIEFAVVKVEGAKEIAIERNKRYNAHLEPISGIIPKLKAGDYKVLAPKL